MLEMAGQPVALWEEGDRILQSLDSSEQCLLPWGKGKAVEKAG
jgi:hypothetical protein